MVNDGGRCAADDDEDDVGDCRAVCSTMRGDRFVSC